MDAFERCSQKLDKINDDLLPKMNHIITDIRAIGTYQRDTGRLVIILWGLGWLLALLGSILWSVWR